MAHYNLYGMKRRSQIKISILALVLAFAVTLGLNMLYSVSAAETETVVVTRNTVTSTVENGSEGWWFNRDPRTKSPYQFTNDESSIGTGSLYVEPIANNYTDEEDKLGNDKFIAENFVWQAIDDFESVSYDFMVAGEDKTSSDAQHFYMNVYVNKPGSPANKYYDCRYDFVPQTGSTTDFTKFTVNSDSTATSKAGAGCPATIGEVEGGTIRMFSISVGDISANDTGLAGYLDNVVLATTDSTTIYDFEATNPDTKK